MFSRWGMRAALALAAISLLIPAGPAAAQGQDIGRAMESEYGVVGTDTREGRRLNAQLDAVVERITDAVIREYGRGDFRLRSARILGGRSAERDRVVNAFALPDGRIYVTLGLMRLIQDSPYSDDELAFVVGHEVTHVVERHSASQARKTLPVNILAAILGGFTRDRTLRTGVSLGAAAYSAKFSRQDEYEADEGALIAMHRAGYNLDAAARMLQRLKEQGGGGGGLLNKWFGTHPMTDNRIARAREIAAELRAGRDPRAEREEPARRERRR